MSISISACVCTIGLVLFANGVVSHSSSLSKLLTGVWSLLRNWSFILVHDQIYINFLHIISPTMNEYLYVWSTRISFLKKLLSHHYPSYGWFWLSTWWDLGSPWKQISEHVRGISSIRIIDVGRTSSLPGVLNWIKRIKWSDISKYCSLWMQCDQMPQSSTSMTFLAQ